MKIVLWKFTRGTIICRFDLWINLKSFHVFCHLLLPRHYYWPLNNWINLLNGLATYVVYSNQREPFKNINQTMWLLCLKPFDDSFPCKWRGPCLSSLPLGHCAPASFVESSPDPRALPDPLSERSSLLSSPSGLSCNVMGSLPLRDSCSPASDRPLHGGAVDFSLMVHYRLVFA